MPTFPPLGYTGAEPPYAFEEAPPVRQRAWAAGFDPAHWYPVALSREIGPGEVREAVFQGYDTHHARPANAPHPAILPSYRLTVSKWEEHLARSGSWAALQASS